MRRQFTVSGTPNNGVAVYFLNFFDKGFAAEYTEAGFSALDLPGLEAEIDARVSYNGWRVEEIAQN